MNRSVSVMNVGEIPYAEAWALQKRLFEQVLAQKKSPSVPGDPDSAPGYLIICQHPHVFTLGRNGKEKNLLLPLEQLQQEGIEYYQVERGGDITYHGPGQLVVYLILDLENFFTDIRRYMRTLEEAVIQTLAEYDLPAGRIDGLTGVWINPEREHGAKKICALGVKTSRWVTLHGLALNVCPDLHYFDAIIPCGIRNHGVTSMKRELSHCPSVEQVASRLLHQLCMLFDMQRV